MQDSGANDVTIRPIASVVAVLRDVSGAVAQGANDISVEVIDHDDKSKVGFNQGGSFCLQTLRI